MRPSYRVRGSASVGSASLATRLALALLAASATLLSACQKPAGPSLAPGAASADAAAVHPSVQAAHAELARRLDLSDPASFADARRGFLAAPSGQVRGADGALIWDFADFAFVKGSAPPSVNPSLWRQAQLNNQVGLFKLAEGLYQLRGFDLANITLIEGKSGWIVVDTLTSRETAAAAMAFARRQLGDKPVSAVVFTHSHVDHFGGALGVISAEEAARRQIPIVAPAGFIEEATSENVLMGAAMSRRAMYMYGSRLPRHAGGLVDDGLGKAVAFGQVGILAPNRLVERTPQAMEIDGIAFEFQNLPGSEAPAELTFYLPQWKAFCGAEMLSHTMHNLYTLRGAKVRDALRWSAYIDAALAQAGAAELYFGSHHWPVWGHERIQDFMLKQRDVYRYTHDQTVRLMNAGLGPDEIAEQLQLPAALDGFLNVHGYYGTLRHNSRAVYQYYLGWFDANPAHLDPLPQKEASQRYVALMGGAAHVLAAGQQAYERGELRWAAELLNRLVSAEPGHQAAREALARCYEQLGYAAESAPWRNFYLSGALELRHGPPKEGVPRSALLDMLAHTPIERFLEAMAAGLNGPKAGDTRLTINLRFSDSGESHVLALYNGVLHHQAAPPAADANATLTLTKPLFLKMLTGSAGVKDTLFSDQLQVQGSRIDLLRFFSLIDKAPGNFAIVARE